MVASWPSSRVFQRTFSQIECYVEMPPICLIVACRRPRPCARSTLGPRRGQGLGCPREGAHFSGHCQVWRPAGGTKGVPGRRLRVRESPARDRMRPRGADPCQGPAPARRPRRRRCAERACGTVPRGTRRRRHPPDVGLAWEGIRHPATMRHVGEHICGFTPFPYSPYSRGNGPGGAISGVVATSCFVGTGYRPKARESGILSDVETRAGTRWTREHHLKKWEPSSGSKDIHSLYFSFTA